MYVESCWLCDQIMAGHSRLNGSLETRFFSRQANGPHWTCTGRQRESPANGRIGSISLFDGRLTATMAIFSFHPIGPMHICSAVRSAGYRAEAASSSTGQMNGAVLRVSVAEAPIYNDEHATLHVELSGQAPSGEQQDGCATLYSVRQGPSIGTRLDP